MPRTIAYGRKNAADAHYDALAAEQPGGLAPHQRAALRGLSDELAAKVAPDAVHPYYVARLASAEDALSLAGTPDLWNAAAEQAAAGDPLPPVADSIARTLGKPEESTADGPLEKIAKYVPAEIITITTLAFAALTPTGSDVWWLVAGGVAANMLYLFGTALHARKETKEMPPLYFYLLSGAALFLWAVAVIPVVGSELGIGGEDAETQKAFALVFAAFIVPLLDIVITGLKEWATEKNLTLRGLVTGRVAPATETSS